MSVNRQIYRVGRTVTICAALAVVTCVTRSDPPRATGSTADSHLTVVLFEYHLPGAYRLLQFDETGRCDYIQFQRSVQRFKQDHLDSISLGEMMSYFSGGAFDSLDDKYDVYPLDPAQPEVVYEDTYYQIVVTTDHGRREVLSHEHAAPDSLKRVIDRLFSLGRDMPDQPVQGTFLLVTEPETVAKIRWLKASVKREVELNDDALSRYPALQKAILTPQWIYSVSSEEAADLEGLFDAGAACIDIRYDGKTWTACLMRGPNNSDK